VVRTERCGCIDRASYRGEESPAVSLYKIDETYFVKDGNYNVSVVKYYKVRRRAGRGT